MYIYMYICTPPHPIYVMVVTITSPGEAQLYCEGLDDEGEAELARSGPRAHDSMPCHGSTGGFTLVICYITMEHHHLNL